MTPETLLRTAIWPALTLLPDRMDSPQARRMLVAIALQESGLRHRRQVARWVEGRPVHGPARGWWQFEVGGVIGVLRHRATATPLAEACAALGYVDLSPTELHAIVEHNDVLAAVFARLNLWWLPRPLPDAESAAWDQYIEAWRPGKPHRHTWATHWTRATAADSLV
jgi:hypothetical protein